MIDGKHDILKSQQVTNQFDQGNDRFNISTNAFWPSIQIKLSQETDQALKEIDEDPDLDIFEDGVKLQELESLDNLKIDQYKLSRYFSLEMRIRTVTKEIDNWNIFELRHCKSKDFTDRGFKFSNEDAMKVTEKRFCPQSERMKAFWQVKNAYTNKGDRVSFSMEIHKCGAHKGNAPDYCQNDEAIRKLFDKLYFTLFYLEEMVEFGVLNNFGKRPTTVQEKFHSQFMLEPD